MPADDNAAAPPTSPGWEGVIVAASIAAICGGGALIGRWPLAVLVVLIQLALTLAWLALTDVPAASSGLVIIVAAALAADLFASRTSPDDQWWVAVVVAAAFVLAMLRQLARRRRAQVTESLASVMTGVMLVVFAAHLIATRAGAGGIAAAALTCFAVAAATATRRVVDAIAPRPALRAGADRGWLGLLLSAAAGAAVGGYIAGTRPGLDSREGVLIGLGAAMAAAIADLGIGLGSLHLPEGRPRSAVAPLVALAPLVAAAPVGYGVARLLAS